MRLVTELPETLEAIARPIAFDITRTVGQLMHLPSVTEILFAGTTDQAQQAGSALNYTGAPSKFPGESRISVSMSEGMDESNVLAENSLQENTRTIFLDRSLGIRLRPIYASTVLTLTFSVRSRSRVEAEKIRDEFRVRAAMGRQQILHRLTYHYGIPDTQMSLLNDLYTLRETVAGYGDTMDTWLRANAVSQLTQISNLVGAGLAWVFAEQQVGVQGTFDFHVQPEAPDKGDDNGMYTYPIEYKVRYDKVVGMSMDYPLVVHNQPIPSKWYNPTIPGGIQADPYASPYQYSDYFSAALRGLYLNKALTPCPIDGVRYPVFDDWLPAQVAPDTSTVYVCMLAANPSDLNDVMDLTDLAGVTLDGDVRAYMATQGANLGLLYLSAIHVELYDGQSWMGDEAITVTADLKVRSTAPLCLRNRYHLRISLMTDLFRLTDSARFALRTQGVACQKILLALQQKIREGNYIPKLQGGKYIPDAVLLECAARINQNKSLYFTGLECRMLTVGNLLISTQRLADYARNAATLNTADATLDPSVDPRFEPAVPGNC